MTDPNLDIALVRLAVDVVLCVIVAQLYGQWRGERRAADILGEAAERRHRAALEAEEIAAANWAARVMAEAQRDLLADALRESAIPAKVRRRLEEAN